MEAATLTGLPFDNNRAGRGPRLMKVREKIGGTFHCGEPGAAFCELRAVLSPAVKPGRDLVDTTVERLRTPRYTTEDTGRHRDSPSETRSCAGRYTTEDTGRHRDFPLGDALARGSLHHRGHRETQGFPPRRRARARVATAESLTPR
jgi:hypothetical protein